MSDLVIPGTIGTGSLALNVFVSGIIPVAIGILTVVYLSLKIYYMVKDRNDRRN